jgi:hypothetical protein
MTRSDRQVSTTRTEARGVECPACGANVDAPCRGAREKPRVSCHLERHQRAALEQAKNTASRGWPLEGLQRLRSHWRARGNLSPSRPVG